MIALNEKPAHQAQADIEKRQVALSSVLAAVLLTSMKIVVGVLTGSLGILSEAAHSALDLVAAIVTLIAVRFSGRPPDEIHTYGHGKIENLSALFETVLLLVTCAWIIYEAIQRLFFKSVEVEANIWAFLIMGISILVDFSRSRALGRIAKKYDSQALEADALHFSTDIWSSTVVIGGLALVSLSRWLKVEWLAKADAVAALGVALIVIYVSLQLGRRTIAGLLDAIPPGVRDDVVQAIEQIPGVLEVSEARIRKSGPEVFADVVLKVDRGLALEQAHEITSQAEAAVRAILPGVDMVFNVVPADVTDEGYFTKVRSLASRRGLGAHSLRIYNIAGSQTLELHLEVGEGLSLAEAHAVADLFESDVMQTFPEIKRVITHLEPGGEKTLHTAAMVREAVSSDHFQVLQALEEYCESSGDQFEPYDLTTHRVGRELMVSFGCRLDPDMALTEAHRWTEQVERALRKKITSIGRVVIHVEPGKEHENTPDSNA